MRTFPSDRIPEGWFHLGWSYDFPEGQPVPLQYFGTDLVAYRGTAGIHVSDAYCPHLGAHLGYGGTIEGDCIRCPFHGWLFGADGRNAEVPYGQGGAKPNVGIRSWPVREVDGVVLVYYSEDAGEPRYPAPPSFVRQDAPMWPLEPVMTRTWRNVPMSPQVFGENGVDAAHFKYIHHADEVPALAEYEPHDGVFRGRVAIEFGGHRPTTWATPGGAVQGSIFTEAWGLGIGFSRLIVFDDITHATGVTPISPYAVDVRATTWVPRTRSDGSELDDATRRRWADQQSDQVGADIEIWSHQTYVHKPALERSEVGPLRQFRQWSKQFYESRSPAAGALAEAGASAERS
jgi:phenylpropionate dioxygenase-like ring-hydroxylating dioxygenase large terminal subunit